MEQGSAEITQIVGFVLLASGAGDLVAVMLLKRARLPAVVRVVLVLAGVASLVAGGVLLAWPRFG